MDETSDASNSPASLNGQVIDFVRSSVIPHITLDEYLANDESLFQQLQHLWFQAKVITDDDADVDDNDDDDGNGENNSSQLSRKHLIDQITQQLERIQRRMENLITKADWKNGQDLDYRIAFALATLFKSLIDITCHRSPLEGLLQQIDRGLIMSPPICKNILATLGQKIHDVLMASKVSTSANFTTPPPCSSPEVKSIQLAYVNCNVPVESALDLMNFQSKYLVTKSPVIIKDTITHWRALSHWNVNYFKQVFGLRWVPVEIGSSYLDTQWRQEVMKFDHFARHYLLNANSSTKGYLAQYNLFHQLPLLRRDISIPDYCSISDANNDVQINVWIGPAGTVSPLHRDPMDNFLCQIYGHKYVKLISSAVSDEAVYPFDGSTKMTNTSQVNVEAVDEKRFVRFSETSKLTFQCVLAPGDILFIPKGWWHFVKSLSSSCSISFWW